jgi:hypothetical protein
VGVVVPVAGDELGKKKQAEIADDQHVRQPRKVIPVGHIITFKIVLQMRFEFFYHYLSYY